jgi:hypothetical protein
MGSYATGRSLEGGWACQTTMATLPWEELTEHFPVLEEIKGDMAEFEGRGAQAITDALVSLYRVYVREWDSFPYHLAKRTPNGSIWPTAQVIDWPQHS